MKWNYKIFEDVPQDAKKLREEIFVKEQGFTEEFDKLEKESVHLVFYDKKEPIATARFREIERNTFKIERVAVKKTYRNQHIGKELMEFLEKEICEKGGEKMVLSSQLQAKKFYESCGFHGVGEIYYDQHEKHIWMEKEINHD